MILFSGKRREIINQPGHFKDFKPELHLLEDRTHPGDILGLSAMALGVLDFLHNFPATNLVDRAIVPNVSISHEAQSADALQIRVLPGRNQTAFGATATISAPMTEDRTLDDLSTAVSALGQQTSKAFDFSVSLYTPGEFPSAELISTSLSTASLNLNISFDRPSDVEELSSLLSANTEGTTDISHHHHDEDDHSTSDAADLTKSSSEKPSIDHVTKKDDPQLPSTEFGGEVGGPPSGPEGSLTYSGDRYRAEVSSFAANSVTSPSGTLTFTKFPAHVDRIVKATLYANNYGNSSATPSATINGVSLSSTTSYASTGSGSNNLSLYKWDITSYITGNGSYSASASGLDSNYGLTAVVVYTDPSLPIGTVHVFDDPALLKSTDPTKSVVFQYPNGTKGKAWFHTTKDDAVQGTNEVLKFYTFENPGTPIDQWTAGPLDAGLGNQASLVGINFTLPTVSPGFQFNTCSQITTVTDEFGWDLLVITPDGHGDENSNNGQTASDPPAPLDDGNGGGGGACNSNDCVNSTDVVSKACGVNCPPKNTTKNPVRYYDGVVDISAVDVISSNFGLPWGNTRSWTNGPGYAEASYVGNGWMSSEMPRLMRINGLATIAVVSNGMTARYFDKPEGTYKERHGGFNKFAASGSQFTMVDTNGVVMVFEGFGTSIPEFQRGQLVSYTDPGGNEIRVISRTTNGKVQEVHRYIGSSTTGLTVGMYYEYNTSGFLDKITLRTRPNSSTGWTNIRTSEYAYYGSSDSNGNSGDLKLVTIKDGSANTIDQYYYRYYTNTTNGYVGGLKYVFTPDSFARASGALSDPLTASDSAIAPYADNYFEYDAKKRVTKEKAQGVGCSACSGGIGEYTFTYVESTFQKDYNSWKVKTTVTLPDGNQNIVYSNAYGQVMMSVMKDTVSGQKWADYYRYDAKGQVVLHVDSGGVITSGTNAYNDAYKKLVSEDSYAFDAFALHDSQGVFYQTTYYASTNATTTTAGGVEGYVEKNTISMGEMAGFSFNTKTLDSYKYIKHEYNGNAVYPYAEVVHSVDGSAFGVKQTTKYAYEWFANSNRISATTVSVDGVTAAQNGPDSSGSFIQRNKTYFDVFGRPTWSKDTNGAIQFYEYDTVSGSISRAIVDVNTSASGIPTPPSGITTTSGYGLHLVTTYENDILGRTTKIIYPAGTVDYITYNEAADEVRYYRGWNGTSHTATLPTMVMREDRERAYNEVLTMNATLDLVSDGSGGYRPTGLESIANVLSVSRSFVNSAGQVTSERAYYDLTGLTYTSNVTYGTLNQHYNQSQYDYDKGGRLSRIVSPNGTIQRTVFDTLGRPSSSWIGINDTPSSGFWSVTNPAAMIKTSEQFYERDSVGITDLTKSIAYTNDSTPNRVTLYGYDWRHRLMAMKQGAESNPSTESTTVQRPAQYLEYDNLDRLIRVTGYDGDILPIADANQDGIPDALSFAAKRSQLEYFYDNRGRVFQTKDYAIEISMGLPSGQPLVTNYWYDEMDRLIRTSMPGGLHNVVRYDGANRLIASYTTDGYEASYTPTWNDRVYSLSHETVLEQLELQLDANSNVLQQTSKQRFHDASGLGTLGTPTTGIGARVSYSTGYYDIADRLTAAVNVGTNGGSAYTRPSSVPSRSDTTLVTSYSYNSAGYLSDVTDPSNVVSHTDFDALGRTIRTIGVYTNGTPTANNNFTTEYIYDPSGNLSKLSVKLPGSAQQTTEYVYGVTHQPGGGTGSAFSSNDMLYEVRYPSPSTGLPSTSSVERFSYNSLGERTQYSDRNGNVHQFGYDVVGRMLTDAVTTLGSGVDGTVRRLETSYDTFLRPYLFTSYSAASGGSVVNQVQREYSSTGQVKTEYQSHSGVVNTSTTPKVQYTYNAVSSTANYQRLQSIVYPNGRTITYDYGSSGGLNNRISRLEGIKESSTTLEGYTYLGVGQIVRQARANDSELTYIKRSTESVGDAGDQYTGLDRFGRIVDQRWLTTSTGTATDRYFYGYDRDSRRKWKENNLNSALGELYNYDQAGQLTNFQRGTLNSSHDAITGTASRTEAWTLDATGNWDAISRTVDGGTAVVEDRTHDLQNRIASVDSSANEYDANGNMTQNNFYLQKYDAWNKLVKVTYPYGNIHDYSYDALGRRVTEDYDIQEDIPPFELLEGPPAKHLYYSTSWQVLEERNEGASAPNLSYVWGANYIDAMIARDRDTDANGSLDERLYAQYDTNWNTTSLTNTSGSVIGRFVYESYGAHTTLNSTWGTSGGYYSWQYLHQGGRKENVGELSHYSFRNRVYDTQLGRWLTQDPIGYSAGDVNLYRYVGNTPTNLMDPSGLIGAGNHHPYPLYLGGGQKQCQFSLTKAEHDAVHKYFKNKGLWRAEGVSWDDARDTWRNLTDDQRWGHISESLKQANIPDHIINSNKSNIMSEAIAGKNRVTERAMSKPTTVYSQKSIKAERELAEAIAHLEKVRKEAKDCAKQAGKQIAEEATEKAGKSIMKRAARKAGGPFVDAGFFFHDWNQGGFKYATSEFFWPLSALLEGSGTGPSHHGIQVGDLTKTSLPGIYEDTTGRWFNSGGQRLYGFGEGPGRK